MWKEYIKKYDKFMINGENVIVVIEHHDWESEERFIDRVEEAIENLPYYPQIVYSDNRIILVV